MPRNLLTLAYVVRERSGAHGLAGGSHEVLLGKKLRGFGLGKWNGFGGKVEASDVSVAAAAARELREEANVGVGERDLESRGAITYTFEGRKETRVGFEMLDLLVTYVNNANKWNWKEVHVLLTKKFQGEPSESDEMLPRWFAQDAIPFDNMWADEDRFWLQDVLFKGKSVRGHYHLAADELTILQHKFDVE